MRTTIRIDDELYRRVKLRAHGSGRTIAEVIEDAIQLALREDVPPTAQATRLPTYGGSGVLGGVDITSNAALRDVMDGDVAVDALR